MSIGDKAKEISCFTGNEASVWNTPEAASSRIRHKAGESSIMVGVGSVDDHEKGQRKEQGSREFCGAIVFQRKGGGCNCVEVEI